jgi:hypothetical protein
MKSAIWLPQSSEANRVPKILQLSGIKEVNLTTSKGLLLTEKNEVFLLSLESLSLKSIEVEVQVSQVLCYSSVCLLIGSGQAFIFGEDHEKAGLLGEETSELLLPKRVEVGRVVKGALSSHAAIVDSDKNLFTWGRGVSGQLGWSGKNEARPSMIDTKKLFVTSEVVCGKNFTAVLTDGGFVNVFGSLRDTQGVKSVKGKILPYSQKELDRITCVQIAAGEDFLVVLSEGNEVFAFDQCLELVKLPQKYGDFSQGIACSSFRAFAVGDGNVVEWGDWGDGGDEGLGRMPCQETKCNLTCWSGTYYNLEPPYNKEPHLFSGSSDYIAMTFLSDDSFPIDLDSSAPALSSQYINLAPYKRPSLLRMNSLQSIRSKCKTLRSDESVSGLQRMYSLGSDDNTAAKIQQFRRDHEFTKSVDEILKPAVFTNISFAFRSIKENATMQKHLEKHLAVAMIIPPIEKILHRRLMTCILLAFRAVFSFAEGKKELIVKKSKEKLEFLHNKEEKFGNFLSIIRKKCFKHLFFAFTLVKDLEMRKLQKQTAVMSVVQVLFNTLKSTKTFFFRLLSAQVTSTKAFQRSMTHLLTPSYKTLLSCILSSSKSHLKKSNILTKSIKDLLKKLKTRETRHLFLKWKKNSELVKTSLLKKQYCRQIACKSLSFAISSSVKRQSRQVLTILKHFHRLDLKSAGLTLTKLFKSLTLSSKRKTFKAFQVLLKKFKSLKSFFNTFKKILKKLKRFSFKQVEMFSLTYFKARSLKSSIFLQFLLSKLIQKRLQTTFSSLKQHSKDKSVEFTGGPSFSFFSPKIQKQSSGILRNKKNNSVAFQGHDFGSNYEFAFNTVQRLRKQNSITTTLNLTSPKSIFTSTSSTDTLLTKFGEISLLEKTLKQRKVSESTMKLIKKTAKPPLKPPWKPSSSNASVKKIEINSSIRRSQYDLKLKERVKSHSKHGSSDASQYTSTPTIPSRASSRQKINRKRTFDSLNSITANYKFAVLILDNFRLNLINRRMFESWCRIKYFLKSSPKPPAPKPSDPGKYPSPSSSNSTNVKLTWQDNLYLIGFESLKHLARVVIGRQILESLGVGRNN